jgi:hypothetical protein
MSRCADIVGISVVVLGALLAGLAVETKERANRLQLDGFHGVVRMASSIVTGLFPHTEHQECGHFPNRHHVY